MKNLFALIVLFAVFPLGVSAHGAYALDERIATMWGNPLALLAVAIAAGVLVGGGIFLFRRNTVTALKAGALVGALSALLLFALANPQAVTTPLNPAEGLLVGAVATVYKSPTCGCCSGYIEELKRQGANVTVEMVNDSRLAEIKAEHGVSSELYSCHTSIIDGYVVEGHVPIEAVQRLITEKPDVKGIALPGMPSGTPGMPGPKLAPYEVLLLDGTTFMRI